MKISVAHCQRCGKSHILDFEEFKNFTVDSSGATWAHWAICPNTEEPVIIKNQPVRGGELNQRVILALEEVVERPI